MWQSAMQEAADVLGELEDLRDRLQASEQARLAAEASRPSPESTSPTRHAADSQDLPESVRVLKAELQVRIQQKSSTLSDTGQDPASWHSPRIH